MSLESRVDRTGREWGKENRIKKVHGSQRDKCHA